jgi:hypothetical protein
LDLHRQIAQPLGAALGGQWYASQRANAHVADGQLGHIANATINHHACPAIAGRGRPQVAAQQRAAQRAPAIHHQHPALTRAFDRPLHRRVVFEALDGDHRTREAAHRAEIAEHGRQHTKGTGVIVLVGVTQIAGGHHGGVGHGENRIEKRVEKRREEGPGNRAHWSMTTRSDEQLAQGVG